MVVDVSGSAYVVWDLDVIDGEGKLERKEHDKLDNNRSTIKHFPRWDMICRLTFVSYRLCLFLKTFLLLNYVRRHATTDEEHIAHHEDDNYETHPLTAIA